MSASFRVRTFFAALFAQNFIGNGLKSMQKLHRHLPLLPLTITLLSIIAAFAVISLLLLVRLYENTTRASCTLSAIQYGARVTQGLSRQPYITQSSADREATASFDRLVRALQAMEPGLEYVAVGEDGASVYRRQTSLRSEADEFADREAEQREPVAIGRAKMMDGAELVPLLTFKRQIQLAAGKTRDIQTAFRKDMLDRAYNGATTAIRTMFAVAFFTIIAAFGLCLAAVAGLVHRELTWQRRQRLNEHLAFAGAMAGSIIHDFRNPISAMQLDAQLLRGEIAKGQNGRPARMDELAARILRTIGRINALLNEFLLIARPSSAPQARFELNAETKDCIELVKLRFEKAGLKLQADLAPKALWVEGSPEQFKRALLNVIANAEQFAPAGSTVAIRLAEANRKAVLTVADEGPGIARENLAQIFEMFFSTRPGGTGIGLSLAKAAIENCGGTISAENAAPGPGSIFIIRLPLRKGSSA